MGPPFGREYIGNELRRIGDGLSAPRTGYQRSTGFVETATQSVHWSSSVTTTVREGGRLVGVSAEEFRTEFAERGVPRDAGFLEPDEREETLDALV